MRVGNRGVGKGLSHDGDARTAYFLYGVRLERASRVFVEVCKVRKFVVEKRILFHTNILRDKLALKRFDVLYDLFLQIGELPVAGHHINAQLVGRPHHIHAAGLECGSRALPGIATIDQQTVTRTGY